MKRHYNLLLLPAIAIPLALIAQGPLTPPAGAPAPVMKTLQQIEPRIDVATLTGDATGTFVIAAPGSYYLSANVRAQTGKSGIAISAADVVLDLGGFAVTGVAGTLKGVELRAGATGVSVRNGSISGFPAGSGIETTTTGLANLHFENLTIRNCATGMLLDAPDGVTADLIRVTGCTGTGMDLGDQAVATRCVVSGIAGSGVSTVWGIRTGTARDCKVNQVVNAAAAAVGIFATEASGCTVTGTGGAGNNTSGIQAVTVTDCHVTGVTVTTSSTVRGIYSLNGMVTGCRVNLIGRTGTGSPAGIVASKVNACQVSEVGNLSSTGTCIGIDGIGSVSDCSLSSIGIAGGLFTVTGLDTPLASHCKVDSLSGALTVNGIVAETATGCSVASVNQGIGTGNSLTAFLGQRFTDCRAGTLNGNSTNTVTAFSGYRLATGCLATSVVNNGTGTSRGFAPASAGLTEQCVVDGGAMSHGIFATTACVVQGCSVRLSSGGTGLELSGVRCKADENTISGCATGIVITGANCFVVRNRLTNCTLNFDTNSPTSQVGPVVFATGSIVITNPWTNFTD